MMKMSGVRRTIALFCTCKSRDIQWKYSFILITRRDETRCPSVLLRPHRPLPAAAPLPSRIIRTGIAALRIASHRRTTRHSQHYCAAAAEIMLALLEWWARRIADRRPIRRGIARSVLSLDLWINASREDMILQDTTFEWRCAAWCCI